MKEITKTIRVSEEARNLFFSIKAEQEEDLQLKVKADYTLRMLMNDYKRNKPTWKFKLNQWDDKA